MTHSRLKSIAVAWVAAVAWVQSLAWELVHAMGAPPPKKKAGRGESLKSCSIRVIALQFFFSNRDIKYSF